MQGWPEGLGASPKRLLDTPSARATPAVLGWTPASQGPSRQPPGPGATRGLAGTCACVSCRASSSGSLSAETCSLFLPSYVQDTYLLQLLRSADDVSTWVAAEIVTSHTSKVGALSSGPSRVGAAGSKGASLGDPRRPVPAARTRRPHAGTPPLTAGRGVTHTLTRPPRAPTLLLPRSRPSAGNWPAGLSSRGHCHNSTGACVSSASLWNK